MILICLAGSPLLCPLTSSVHQNFDYFFFSSPTPFPWLHLLHFTTSSPPLHLSPPTFPLLHLLHLFFYRALPLLHFIYLYSAPSTLLFPKWTSSIFSSSSYPELHLSPYTCTWPLSSSTPPAPTSSTSTSQTFPDQVPLPLSSASLYVPSYVFV